MSTGAIAVRSAESVRTLLQTNIAIMLAMSGTIFACAEGAPLAAATVPIAWMGLMFVDRRPVLRLNTWIANGLGLLTVLAVAVEFSGETVESRLLAFGHFLCYLSWILLMQEKKIRQIWWLCALSVLQVATSAVLTNSPWLGLALILYVTYALFTLSVFSLYRAVNRSAGVDEVASVATRRGRSHGSLSRNAVRLESATKWITPRFVAGVAVNGVVSIALGLTIFVLTPRVWVRQIQAMGGQPLPATRSTTGASDSVNLGDLSQIMENPDLVMEVRFTDARTENPITVEQFLAGTGFEAPLYRGNVLDEYDHGRWSTIDTRDPRSVNWRILNSPRHFFRQDIRLRPTGSDTLFIAQRGVTCLPKQRHEQISHDTIRNTFQRESDNDIRSEVYEYAAFSLGADEPSRWRTNDYRQYHYVQRMARLPDGLEPVRDLAEEISQTTDDEKVSAAEKAQRLLTKLRDSGEYTYSLDAGVKDPTVDPVIDFLVNRKEGHCEYFASALALMLRAVDIPSRLVSGFKGGAYNEGTGYYEIRQLHAHAWVEAFVDDDWIILDPTPAARDETVAATAGSSYFWTDLMTRARDLWGTAMLLSGNQQKQMLFDPLQKSAGGWFRTFAEVGSELSSGFADGAEAGQSGSRRIWQFLIGAVVVALLIGGAVLGIRGVGWRFRGRRKDGHTRWRYEVPEIPFYKRFRDILAHSGEVRQAPQTQHEFAAALQNGRLFNGHTAAIGDLPEAVTRAFYQVRFGDHPLATAQLSALDASLDRLEQSLQNGNAGNGSKRHS